MKIFILLVVGYLVCYIECLGRIYNLCKKDKQDYDILIENTQGNKNIEDEEVGFITCGNYLCDVEGGWCNIKTNKCTCKDTHTSYDLLNYKQLCSYKKYSKMTALFLEFFFPIGIGHFYCKRIVYGCIKFMITMTILALSYFKIKTDNKIVIIQFFLAVFSIMYLFDFIGFTTKLYRDGNGIKMY